MAVRGVRGAVQASGNTAELILQATQDLLIALLEANPGLQTEEIASAWFTATPDLNAEYPARAARMLGWQDVPLLCAQEMSLHGSLPRCIRVLLHWNTDLPQSSVRPVYLGAAASLRPDLAGPDGPPLQTNP